MNILRKFYIPKFSDKKSRSYNTIVIALLVLALVFSILLSIGLGSSDLKLSQIIDALINNDTELAAYKIIRFVRIPRIIAAILTGCALSVSGLILQSVLNNSLASPGVIGVNSGAGLFTVLIAAFFPAYLEFTPAASFIGACIATLMVYAIAKKTGASRMTIVLAGLAVSSFIGAITDTVLTLKPDTALSRTEFLIGGLSGVAMDELKIPGIFILVSISVVSLLGYDMNVLLLGDDMAKSLGLHVSRYRFIFLVLAALLAGSAISFAGLIGFIGLIVPHAARFIIGYDSRLLVPVSALLGSVFTLFCDLLSRILFAPFEIPVGIIMAFLGGPFFIYLLLKQKRRRIND